MKLSGRDFWRPIVGLIALQPLVLVWCLWFNLDYFQNLGVFSIVKIPDPNKPPMPMNPYGNDDETLRILIITVDRLMKEVKALETRIDELERGK